MSTLAPSNRTGVKSQLADYYLWEEPERGIKIGLNLETVDRLQMEVLRGIEGFPVDNAEVGGILIGRTELDGDQTITLIEDFATVQCSYRSGPLYRLSEKDIVNLEAALTRCSSDNRGLSVVGYYRSHNREDLFLSSDDLKLIQKYFPEKDKVFLLVKTLPSRACTAGFFFWENGSIQSEFTYLEVPFGPIQSLPAVEVTRTAAVRVDNLLKPAKDDLSKKLPGVQSLQLPEAGRPHHRVWLMRGTVVAAVAVTLASLNYWLSRRSNPQEVSSTASTSLGLGVERKSGSLTLTWNPKSRDILVAEEAVLYINEGTKQKALHLDPSQLRSGSVTFAPSSDDIELRLEIDRGGKPSAAEKVHLLLPDSSVGVSEHETAQGETYSQKVSALKKTVVTLPHISNGETGPQDMSKSSLTTTSAVKQEQGSPKPFRFVAPTRSLTAGSSVPATNDIQIDQPPSIPIETKTSELIVASATVRPEAPPPPIPAVERRPTAQAEGPVTLATPAASGKAASPQPPAVTSFVGPHLIQQVNPSIPLDLRSKITSDVQIDVAVTIDANGKVADAKIESMKGGVARFISGQVLQAARLFQFQPAQDGNRKVESKMVLTFRFSAGQQNEKSTK